MLLQPGLRTPSPAFRPRKTTRARLSALLMATALAPAMMPLLPDSGWMPGIARAQARENVSIDKIEIATKLGTVTLNKLSVAGSSLSRGEIEALFKADALAGLADRVAKFDADSLTIGSIVWVMTLEGQTTTTTYSGFESKAIKAGVAARISFASGAQEGMTKVGDKMVAMKTAYDRMAVETVDFPTAFRWLSEADPSGKAPFKRIHGRYTLDGIRIESAMFTMKTGAFAGEYFDARLPGRPMMEVYTDILLAKDHKDDPNFAARMFAGMMDAMASFRYGPASLDGLSVTGTTPQGEFSAKTGKFEFDGGKKAFGKLKDMEVKAADGVLKINEIGGTGDLSGAMFGGIANALLLGDDMAAKGKNGEAGKNAAPVKTLTLESRAMLEKAVSRAGESLKDADVGFAVTGISGDFPPAKGAKSPERVKFSLAGFETSAGNFVNLVPTRFGIALKNFVMPLPTDPNEKGLETLRELGLDTLDLSSAIKARWTEAGGQLAIEEISADLAKLATVSIKGNLAGVPRSFFEAPSKNWPMLLGSANVQNLNVAVINRGGLDKVIARAAKEQGQQPDQFRFQIASMAPAMIAAVMAGHPDAPKLAEAVGAFLKTLGALSVTAKAVAPGGITAPELMAAAQDPTSLLEKVSIEANGK